MSFTVFGCKFLWFEGFPIRTLSLHTFSMSFSVNHWSWHISKVIILWMHLNAPCCLCAISANIIRTKPKIFVFVLSIIIIIIIIERNIGNNCIDQIWSIYSTTGRLFLDFLFAVCSVSMGANWERWPDRCTISYWPSSKLTTDIRFAFLFHWSGIPFVISSVWPWRGKKKGNPLIVIDHQFGTLNGYCLSVPACVSVLANISMLINLL